MLAPVPHLPAVPLASGGSPLGKVGAGANLSVTLSVTLSKVLSKTMHLTTWSIFREKEEKEEAEEKEKEEKEEKEKEENEEEEKAEVKGEVMVCMCVGGGNGERSQGIWQHTMLRCRRMWQRTRRESGRE